MTGTGRAAWLAALTIFALGLPAQARAPRAAFPADVTFPANAFADLDVQVAAPPQPVPAEGRQHLVYEIRLSNFERRTVTLQDVEVLSGGRLPRVLAHLTSSELKGMTLRRGSTSNDDVLDIPGGGVALVYIWITLERGAPIPAALVHRLTTQLQGDAKPQRFVTPPLPVNRAPPVVIDPPLRGERWGAFNGPSNTSNHRRSFIVVDGRETIAQRFATDWAKLTQKGDTALGDEHVNSNHVGYGEPVYAVADGIVTTARNDLSENTPPDAPKTFQDANALAGNLIIERIGPRQFALYAHLQGASIHLKPGDRIRRGQVIGHLGNSGNSTGPHLHFHICDSNSALGCEGVPFVFRSYTVAGHAAENGIISEPPTHHRMETPLKDEIVSFGR